MNNLLDTINDKNLKYEIETRCSGTYTGTAEGVPINDKNLKYEIETFEVLFPSSPSLVSINDKNLKYEIETCFIKRSRISLYSYQ